MSTPKIEEQETAAALVSVELAVPLTTPSGVVSTVTLRRGKAKDMVRAQQIEPDQARRELLLMAMLSKEKLTIEDMEELDLADLVKVQAAFQELFLPPAGR